ncbi:MAG TPA: S9 family peptidase [Terriglobales bacterium]|nr:S9 family peptidase [Terriglobales bacterium]
MKRFLSCFLGLVLFACVASAQQAGMAPAIAPNENLIIQNIPAVPSALAERANRYTEFRTATLFGWHPQRREILIGTRFADTVQLHRVNTPGGARTQLTFFPDRISDASYRPHLGNYFVFLKDVGGGEWFQIYRDDVDSGNITLLTDGKSRNLGIVWSNKGDRIAYSSTRRNGTDLDFYVMDPSDKSTDRLMAQNQGGGWQVADWSPDERTLLAVEEISINESYLWLVDVASGNKTLITPKGGEKVAYAPIGFSADGKGIYLTSDRDNEFPRIALIDLATKQPKYLTQYSWDIEGASLSWNRKLIAFAVNENGLSTLHVLDLSSNQERPLPKTPTGTISAVSWHENNRELGFALNSARSPLDVYSIDILSGKLERWTRSETGGLNAEAFVEPKLVKWKSFDDREISGWLYTPAADKFPGKRPVIVNIHGGPESQARPGYLGRNNYFINEMGIAILFPNVRGSSGYGKTFVAMDNGFKREDSYKDIESLLNWIKQQPNLDGDKILVTGGSYGGHMTLATATRYNDMICCSIDVVGMSNLVTFLEHTESYRRDLRRVEYGDERNPQMRTYLESIAPMNHVKNVTRPMFVVAGANDPRVPKSEADQMVAALEQQGTPVWYLVGKDEGHGFAKKKNADFQFYATILFIEKYLLGKNQEKTGD